MTILEKVSEWKRHEDKRYGALSALSVLTDLDANARRDLTSYLLAFNQAAASRDEEEQEYLIKAMLEILDPAGGGDAPDLDEWEREARSSPSGRAAGRELDDETEAFFKSYQKLKAKSGLTTIRKVARAAGISPTTVQAIEKQRVKPQFKTIQALAKAFGVDPVVFGNCEG